MVLGHEPRQTTSNLGHLNKPSIQVHFIYASVQYIFIFSKKSGDFLSYIVIFLRFVSLVQALIHGLNRHYYSITINYRKNELEQKVWTCR